MSGAVQPKRNFALYREAEEIDTDAIIRYVIPERALPVFGNFETDDSIRWRFSRPIEPSRDGSVPGGRLTMLVRGPSWLLKKREKAISAHVTVVRKSLTDGSQQMYLVLTGVGDDVPVTSLVRFYSHEVPPEKKGWKIFPYPEPYKGALLLSPAKN